MVVSFEVVKIIKCDIYNTVFIPSGGGLDDKDYQGFQFDGLFIQC